MTKHNRVVIESGSKKVFASAIDWPGWSRSAKSEDAALDVLTTYADRYQKVAEIAGVSGVRSTTLAMEIIDRVKGTATTDFGAPDVAVPAEEERMDEAECGRQIMLLEACWTYFDDAVSRVSEELQKGPRGGGRNRSKIVAHVLESEWSYARKIGVITPAGGLDSAEGILAHRNAVCTAIRELNAVGASAKWPLRYFIRRAAWHVLDHAWEMEDKDLTNR